MTIFDYMQVDATTDGTKTYVDIQLKQGFTQQIPKTQEIDGSLYTFTGYVMFLVGTNNGTSQLKSDKYKDGDTISLTFNEEASTISITVKAQYSQGPAPLDNKQTSPIDDGKTNPTLQDSASSTTDTSSETSTG